MNGQEIVAALLVNAAVIHIQNPDHSKLPAYPPEALAQALPEVLAAYRAAMEQLTVEM